MRPARFIIAFAIVAAPMATAHAADIAQLPCPLNALAPEARAHVATVVATLASQDDPAVRAFDGAVARCASDLHWNADEREAARKFGLASLGHEELRRLLARDGIDIAPMERAILNDGELGRAMRSPAFAESDVQAFLRRNLATFVRLIGLQGGNEPLMERVGVYIALRAFVEASRHRFTGE